MSNFCVCDTGFWSKKKIIYRYIYIGMYIKLKYYYIIFKNKKKKKYCSWNKKIYHNYEWHNNIPAAVLDNLFASIKAAVKFLGGGNFLGFFWNASCDNIAWDGDGG